MAGNQPPKDHALDDEDALLDDDFESNVKSRSTWLRLVWIVVFCALYAVSRVVVAAVVVLQFFWVLFSGATNPRLTSLGHSLALYTCQVIDYLTWNTHVRPFPFEEDWPVDDDDDGDGGG